MLPSKNPANVYLKNPAIILLMLFFSMQFGASLLAAPTKDNFREMTAAMQPGDWLELPGNISQVFVDKNKTQGNGQITGPASVIIAWNGAAWDDNCGYFLGGGHADYGGNEVYSYCWEGKQPFRWEVLMPPSQSDPNDKSDCPHPKEGPRAYHTYDGILYTPNTKSIFIWGTIGFCLGNTFGVDEVPQLILEPKPKWKLNPKGPIQGFAHTAYNDRTGQIYIWQGSGQVFTFDPKTFKYETSGDNTANYGANANMLYDNQRNVLWVIHSMGLFQFVLKPNGEVTQFKEISTANQFPAMISGGDGMELRQGKLYFWPGDNTVYKFDPDNDKWSTYVANKGPTRAGGQGIFSKWRYLEKYDVFVGVSHYTQGMWVWKPAEGKG